jgi:hypothetical protein
VDGVTVWLAAATVIFYVAGDQKSVDIALAGFEGHDHAPAVSYSFQDGVGGLVSQDLAHIRRPIYRLGNERLQSQGQIVA